MTDHLKKTQPIPPPTAADVLEVFGHFQDGLLRRIDERDENVLKSIQKFVSDILEQYQRATERGDDHERRLKSVEKKLNELTSEFNALKLKLRDPR